MMFRTYQPVVSGSAGFYILHVVRITIIGILMPVLLVQFMLSMIDPVTAVLPPSMVNDTTCQSLGINDVAVYQYNFPITSEFGSTYKGPVFFPIFSSVPLNKNDAGITQVLIAIHGEFLNANDFFCLAYTAAQRSSSGVLVIAPW
jgi:hypothetical protein